MKIDWKAYIELHKIDFTSMDLSETMIQDLETYYSVYGIEPAPLLLSQKYTEEEIRDKIDRIVLRTFEIRFHNVGDKPYKRFFRYGGHYEWLKTLHLLISHIYYYAKEFKNHDLYTNIGNKKIAETLGYITADETNIETIQKALRKVTDSLGVLKRMNLITVDHIHNPGKRGSRHKIRLNWIGVIKLFQETDFNTTGTIRIRKTIRYRIITFVKKVRARITKALRRLLQKQELCYLKDVVIFNLNRFQEDKFLIFKILSSEAFGYLATPKSMLTTEYFVPVIYDHGAAGQKLVLKIKSDIVYKDLRGAMFMLIDDFKEKYNIDLDLEIAFSVKDSVLI